MAAPANSPKNVKKTAAAKKPAEHPPVATMVTEAVKTLKDRKGSSLAAIKKYIAANYKVDVVKLAPFIRRFLKSAVASGKITQVKGTGAAGSFKVGQEEKPKKEAKKPKEKKAETKAEKPTKAKKTPKKAAAKAEKPKAKKAATKVEKPIAKKTEKAKKVKSPPKKEAVSKKPKADKKPKKTPSKKAAKPTARKTAASKK